MFVIICAVLAVLLGIVWVCLIPGSTAPITDGQGKEVPGSISSLEKVKLGGADQWILIRGASTANPVLLFLHGGPGTSEMGLVRKYNSAALENHFTVVVWDQRGAGKSFAALNPVSAMNVEQLISDTHELTLLLCRRFNQEKIFLVGHSWGSALGVLTVQRYPELYHAYVGIGQIVNMLEGERLSYAWTLAEAKKAGDAQSVRKLEAMGTPPYSGNVRSNVMTQRSILARLGGEVYNNPRGGFFIILGSLLSASEYSWIDRINFFRGIFATMDLMWPQILHIDLMERASELKVPVFFLEGRHDYEAPSDLVDPYYIRLKAPAKNLIWFENSAHFVNAEESEKFNEVLVNQVRHLRGV